MIKNFAIIGLAAFSFYAWFRLPPKVEFQPSVRAYWPTPSDSWLIAPAISIGSDGPDTCVAGKYYKGTKMEWTVHNIMVDGARQDIGCNCPTIKSHVD
jgi:hypothetical protein